MDSLKIISFPKRHSRNYIVKRVERMCQLLSDRYNIINEEVEKYETLNEFGKPELFKLKHSIIIEHENKHFKIIDWGDRDAAGKFDTRLIVKSPLCNFVLKCQYNSFKTVNPKVKPFFYFDKHDPHILSDNIDLYRELYKPIDTMYFRGNLHLNRDKVLKKINRIVTPGFEELVERDVYFEEMAMHKLALSLPGLGKSCHREFEAFAVGTPVIMIEFKNHYYKNLIPDYHYISIGRDPSDMDRKPQRVAEAIRKSYKEVIKDSDFLDEIRKNAMQYYDEYIRYESSVKWLIKFLKL